MSFFNPPVELDASARSFLASLLREQHGIELGSREEPAGIREARERLMELAFNPEASCAAPPPVSSAGDIPDDETADEDDYVCYCQECGDPIEGMTEEEFADDSELHLCEACEIAQS